jgi:putative tryptophan/tyrosine transport system substrate-binding protein
MIRRWTLISALVVIFAFLTAVTSQAENARRIAFFSAASGPNYLADAFKLGLQDAGYIEGRNLTIEYRWVGGREKDYRDIASELAQLKVDAIVTAGHPAALAAKSATSQIPIVALAIVDPVGSGLAESLSRPGGNVTGFSLESTPQTNAKMIQLLSEAISGLTRVGVLWNSANPGSRVYLDAMREAAEPLGVILQVHDVRSAEDIDLAFHALKGNAEGLVVFPEPLMWTKRQHIVDMARAAGLPTIYGWRAATEIGGLMSYGPDLVDVFKRGAGYVDKVLKGAKPADLPIQQPTKFDLVINLNTAKALGVDVPSTMVADVIE